MDVTTIDLEQMGRAAKAAATVLSQLTTAQKMPGCWPWLRRLKRIRKQFWQLIMKI